MISEAQIKNVLESGCEYVCLWVGSYGIVYLDPIGNSILDIGQRCADETGGIFCDMDTFIELFKESSSINPFLIELIWKHSFKF